MTRPLATAMSLTALAAVALLVMQIARPDLVMTGAVIVPWLLLATFVLVLAGMTEEER
ncbi:hypothetical protein [Cellulomonas sp. KH9]|uniref:hypothetical protein n=1 Tax=Cellulomonas sp. KH9 TaxID=1855324 RepID=UPI0008E6D601|nr:hypothetical protein [Cellulomonas sp. KH9]SFK32321.1 hypothetical protein SAMN05216467_2886 [Cellulomonas sp. KH9]